MPDLYRKLRRIRKALAHRPRAIRRQAERVARQICANDTYWTPSQIIKRLR